MKLTEEHILNGLTPSQREAVTTVSGPLLILAGAGSGKTRVITHRTAYLMLEGIAGHSILCLTFTNKAANEMKERVFSLLGLGSSAVRGYGVPFLSTFHSFCVWVLRRFADRLGYGLDFTVVDDTDQLGIVKEVLRSLNLDPKRFSPRGLVELISSTKTAMVEPGEIPIDGPISSLFPEIYGMYQRILKEGNLMDFDDLLVNTLRLLENEEVVLRFLSERFTHIMVDEYQDTNRIQYLIVKLLSQDHRNLCVVGDDDQSIYSWRGADIRNILDFEKDFPEAKVVKLEENFRSTESILNAAWHVIRNNTLRKQKRLKPVKPGGEKVKLFVAESDREEAAFVAEEIERLKRPYKDYAIFYRTNAQSRAFEEALINKGIPYVVVGGIRFYERKEIKDILAYLRFIRNPNDIHAFKRIVNVPARGIGTVTVNRILEYVQRSGQPLWEILKKIDTLGVLSRGIASKVKSFVELIEGFMMLKDMLSVYELVQTVIEKTGYRAMLEAEGTREAEGRLENLVELVNVASEYDDEEDGLCAFLDRTALAAPVDEVKAGDAVTLMTLHSAKGLEFPVVFMVGMEEGFLPHYRSQESTFALEEERRLCYVGMTRAKELLYLTRAEKRLCYGSLKYNQPSRFLEEIPDELVEKIGVPVESRCARCIPSEPPKKFSLSKGDTVVHPHFGKGKVIEVTGSEDSLKVRVRFYKYGVKLLSYKHANLRKVG